MKQKPKLLLKTLLLCFVVFFASCEKEPDFLETEKNIQSKVKIEKFSMPDENSRLDLNLNPQLLLKINEIKSKNLLAQTLPFTYTQFKFSFNEFDGLSFKIGTYQSYTFPVTRQNGDGKIENVVFSLNVEGKYDAYLVKYPFTKSELATMTLEKINKTLPQYIDLSRVSGIPNIICIDHQYATEVYEGDLDGNPTETQWVVFETFCGNIPIGGGGGFDGNVGTSPYTGGGYGGGGTTPTTQNQEHIIKLNTLTNSSVVKPKMQDLAGRITDNVEYGYEFKTNSQNRLVASNLIVGTVVDGVQFDDVEAYSLVRIHDHPNNVEPIPTLKDAMNFCLLYLVKRDLGARDANDATVITLSKIGGYAFRVQDGNKMELFYNKYLTNEEYSDKLDKLFAEIPIKANANCNGCSDEQYDALLELFFLNIMKNENSGIAIYYTVPVTPTNPNYTWYSL